MEAAKRPAAFNRWQPLWQQWHRWLDNQRLTPLQACLGFVMAQPEINRVVVGVDSLKHLQEIVAASHVGVMEFPNEFENVNSDLINPSKWTTV